MFEDDDPVLARVRAAALRLPEAEERISHGRPTWRAGSTGKLFGVLGGGVKGGAPDGSMLRLDHGLILLPDPIEEPALREDPRCFLPAYYGPSGWFGIDLASPEMGPAGPDWDEIAELLESSYRRVASARLVRVLDGPGQAAPPRRPEPG